MTFTSPHQEPVLDQYIFDNVVRYVGDEVAAVAATSEAIAAEAVKRLIGAFLYGMMGSLFGIGVAIAFRDKYMLICLPFMINYIYQQVLGKLASDCMVAEKYEKITWIEAMRTESIMNISGSVTWLIPFVVMLVIYVVLIGVFYLSMKIGEKQKQ